MALAGEVLDRISTEPGVYLFKDARGTVVYVGKAKSLRTRVRQYFRPGGDIKTQSRKNIYSPLHGARDRV